MQLGISKAGKCQGSGANCQELTALSGETLMRPGCCQGNSGRFKFGVTYTTTSVAMGSFPGADPDCYKPADLGSVRVFLRQGNARAALRTARSRQLLSQETQTRHGHWKGKGRRFKDLNAV